MPRKKKQPDKPQRRGLYMTLWGEFYLYHYQLAEAYGLNRHWYNELRKAGFNPRDIIIGWADKNILREKLADTDALWSLEETGWERREWIRRKLSRLRQEKRRKQRRAKLEKELTQMLNHGEEITLKRFKWF